MLKRADARVSERGIHAASPPASTPRILRIQNLF
jgi:hypothetical protein